MNILTSFAQTATYEQIVLTPAQEAAIVALVLGIFMFSLVFALLVYIFVAICNMGIFKKAGVKPWIAWVPFYNNWKFLEIGGQNGFWAILAVIPIVNIASAVFMIIAMYHIGKKLGKDGIFLLWGIFLPYVWYPWLAFDKSTWDDSKSSAPSLHEA